RDSMLYSPPLAPDISLDLMLINWPPSDLRYQDRVRGEGSARGDSATIRTRRHLRLDIKAVPHALHVGIPGEIAVIGVSLDLPCALQDLGVGRRDAEAVAHEAFRPFP